MNLAALAEAHPPGSVALVGHGRSLSWGELRAEVAAWRRGLSRLGVVPGDRVAIVCPNIPLFVVAYLAVLGAGAVAVPLDPSNPAVELSRQLGTVRAKAVIALPPAAEIVAGLDRAGLGLEHVCVPRDPAFGGTGAAVPAGCVPLGRAVADEDEGGFDAARLVPRAGGDLASLLFTAGTGGAPKPAMLTHGSLLANLDQMQRLPGRAVLATDVCLGALPLFHIYGLNVVLGLALASGAALALVEKFDPAGTLEVMASQGVTVVAGVPAMFAAWVELAVGGGALAEAGAGGRLLGRVRVAVSGAAPLRAEVATAFSQCFGVPLWEGYGLTEASPTVTSSLVEGRARPGAIGAPLPGVEVRVVDEDGTDALVGDPGEILVRGPNVFAGYWEEPEATAAVLDADGWLHTGDVAVVDDEGSLRLVDRAKDLIIVSGFNVYPAEVEAELAAMPGVAEVAVVGVPDARTGEAVQAYVVPEPGRRLREDDLVGSCRRRLARYKCPSSVVLVAALPHGAGGKLLRRQLRGGPWSAPAPPATRLR